jgi:hypothetical protein
MSGERPADSNLMGLVVDDAVAAAFTEATAGGEKRYRA